MHVKEKKHYDKIIIGAVMGILLSTIGVYAATVLSGSDVTYDNSKSGGSSTSVQGSIEELYKLSEEAGKKCPEGYTCIKNTVGTAYTYNQTSGASNYCVTGTESTCQKTECYKNKTVGSCPAGTIINFKVNETVTVPFHVMFDEGETMTMQSQKNIVDNVKWYSDMDSKNGPMVVLPALENATSSWENVLDQTYTAGTTNFSNKGKYTGCNNNGTDCSTNIYSLSTRTGKSRMITIQEAQALGCNGTSNNCPKWMINYLKYSISYGGTVNTESSGYWTMTAHTNGYSAFCIQNMGQFSNINAHKTGYGARAVVKVSK